MSSNCRACGRRGHWKAECPYRTGSNRSVGSSAASTAPTTTVVTEGNAVAASQSLPMEFMQLPEVNESAIDEDASAMTKGRMTDSERTELGSVEASRDQNRLSGTTVSSSTEKPGISDTVNLSAAVLFATHSSLGVLDLGATKTVIGSEHANIDCHNQRLSSPWFKNPVPLQLTNKGLFLVDLNDMIQAADSTNPKSSKVSAKTGTCHETFASEETDPVNAPSLAVMSMSQRLSKLYQEVTVKGEDLSHLTLEELSAEKIKFGEKHQGATMEHVWRTDPEWIRFMVNRYETSVKPEHQRLMKFVELKLKYHEENQLPVRVPKAKSTAAPMTSRRQPKCKAAPRTPIEVDEAEISDLQLIESDATWENMSHIEMSNPETMPLTDLNQQHAEEFQALQTRMLNMENALSRVIRHLEDQANDSIQEN
ncbi:unnamed protein product [Cladocopium goreaui]|uniref:Retrovirus-related Pol polyprotein from type-1 retrotransposable element R2 n=1 Tax=Cladocopium goreaui TaxID=2562237 RepID=A0A9P1CJ59_9DINO|nr:unnamed protein product [Cladocopium goreaui]